ncbi:hypothetical protein LAZ67_X000978 [Cordylochernes scorpioides]|uniref:Uncharacterized protein n=1 Tax=Cordylochernes scorpioides TaxID=51811 RepID=A0ABY6LWC1_9ARAC|nr:hypothetical protein LAZ67_X000978 [Cordylochernes scorpioides]
MTIRGEKCEGDKNSKERISVGFVMDGAMEEVVEEEINRCFEILKKQQAIDVNYIDFLEVDKMCKLLRERTIEEIEKEVVMKFKLPLYTDEVQNSETFA